MIANPRASTKWSIKVKLLAISHTLKFFRNIFSNEQKKKPAVLSLGFDKKKYSRTFTLQKQSEHLAHNMFIHLASGLLKGRSHHYECE